jgi:hypothetical protein
MPALSASKPTVIFEPRRDNDRVPKCAGDLLAGNFHDLKVMAMQVHRVRHPGVIGEIDLHAFTASDIEGVTIWVSRAINCPDIVLHLVPRVASRVRSAAHAARGWQRGAVAPGGYLMKPLT